MGKSGNPGMQEFLGFPFNKQLIPVRRTDS